MSFPRCAILVLLLPAVALAAEKNEKGTGLPKFSPFEQRGGPATPAPTTETIEFAGVSSIGQKTDLIFYDKTAKKSHWIAKGETKEGITVLNYDERREVAVVKYNGVEKTLALRKGAGPTGTVRTAVNSTGFNVSTAAPVVAPVPVQVPIPADVAAANGVAAGPAATPTAAPTVPLQPAPPPGSPAEVQARQETEARMLVSDLLEIGMAQRRAYEEAQRKAAEGNPNNPPPVNPTGATPQPAQPAR